MCFYPCSMLVSEAVCKRLELRLGGIENESDFFGWRTGYP